MAKNVEGRATWLRLLKYLSVKLLSVIPALLVASILIFLVMRALPGDVSLTILSGSPHTEEMREALRTELGLNEPVIRQYINWISSMADGSFGGISLVTRERIADVLKRQLPVTGLLTVYATILAAIVYIPLGIAAAYKKGKWPDLIIRTVTMGGVSLPHVLTANIVLVVLLVAFRWSPPVIYAGPGIDVMSHIEIMVWPSLLLSWELGSHLVRITRTGVLENLQKQHVVAARGRGLSERRIVTGYAFRNALLPVTTEFGIQIGTLMSGVIILESVFGLPGIGRGLIEAALGRDYPVVMSLGTLLIAGYMILNGLIDMFHMILDPRVLTADRGGGGFVAR